MFRFTLCFAVLTLCCAGCGDSPEVPAAAYGNVVQVLPVIPGAEEPFKFLYDDKTDHTKCKFNPETGELVKNKDAGSTNTDADGHQHNE
ncbi:MAG: hypothetical protein LBT89_08540 [Planctomycetaceae bacterium]|nr:hypothetical protein [Planctomycetaceae bacterium]